MMDGDIPSSFAFARFTSISPWKQGALELLNADIEIGADVYDDGALLDEPPLPLVTVGVGGGSELKVSSASSRRAANKTPA